MKVFQFHTFYIPYINYFNEKYPEAESVRYSQRLSLMLEHRFQAAHILHPVYLGGKEVVFSVVNDSVLQHTWAKEHGAKTHDLTEILLAQIEESKADILYSLHPVIYDTRFLKKLPGNIKKKICWLAAPQSKADLSGYDLHLSNFDSIRANISNQGVRTAWFRPSLDPAMHVFARNEIRPIDISFVGGYSSYHKRRNELLEVVSQLSRRYFVSFRLLSPKWKPLSEKRFLNRIPLPIPYLPETLGRVSGPAVFGTDMYDVFGKSKVVFNAAIDMAANDRGNMRCFEALGCGAAMVSDDGNYTDGFTPGKHFITFRDGKDVVEKIEQLLENPEKRLELGKAGNQFVEGNFTKQAQWEAFCKLAAD